MYGARADENYPLDFRLAGRFEQLQRADQVPLGEFDELPFAAKKSARRVPESGVDQGVAAGDQSLGSLAVAFLAPLLALVFPQENGGGAGRFLVDIARASDPECGSERQKAPIQRWVWRQPISAITGTPGASRGSGAST